MLTVKPSGVFVGEREGEMQQAIIRGVLAVFILGAMLGAGAETVLARGPKPTVLICHWTPAHGGTYVHITAPNAGGHARHAHDLIDPAGGVCGAFEED
jgi:hypothetical protein